MMKKSTSGNSALLNTKGAAEYLNVTPRTLEAWRLNGGGPAYVKISSRMVRYRSPDLDTYIEERLVRSTSDGAVA